MYVLFRSLYVFPFLYHRAKLEEKRKKQEEKQQQEEEKKQKENALVS